MRDLTVTAKQTIIRATLLTMSYTIIRIKCFCDKPKTEMLLHCNFLTKVARGDET